MAENDREPAIPGDELSKEVFHDAPTERHGRKSTPIGGGSRDTHATWPWSLIDNANGRPKHGPN